MDLVICLCYNEVTAEILQKQFGISAIIGQETANFKNILKNPGFSNISATSHESAYDSKNLQSF